MKISLEEIISRINNYHGDKYNYPFIKDEYLNSHSYITIICNKCEHIFKQQVYSHVNEKNGCPKCVGVLKLTTEQILIRFREIHKDKYEYPKIFKEHENIKSKITVVCKKCSDVFKVSVNHHMYSKSGCRNCHHNKPNTINRILEKSIKVHGENRYSYPYINNEKIGSYDKITIFCNRCKQTFKQRVYSHILIGNGCPKCNKSKAEQSIHNYLLMNKVNFIPQYKFENCKNIRQLPFDFYLPDYNTCIEYDGELHFNKRRDDELDNLKCRKLKDDIKTNFCLKNNIILERINYKENISIKMKDILEKLSIIEICNFYDSVIVFSDKKSKICTSCYIEKNLLEFNKSSIMFDGHKSLCRKCTSEKGKIYYEKNKIERI